MVLGGWLLGVFAAFRAAGRPVLKAGRLYAERSIYLIMKKLLPFRWVALLLATMLFGGVCANAQNIYCVRPGATGANNGSDWNNAYTSLPASLVRGATYYLAAGNYGSYNFNTPDSGTSVITIRAATIQNPGTTNGWNNSYAGQALFTADCDVQSDYWLFDGQTRSGYTNSYNLKFKNSTDGSGYNVYIDLNDTKVFNNLSFQYCEFEGTHGVFGLSDEGIYIYPQCNNFYMGYCYMHDMGGNPIIANYGGGAGTGYTFEYSYFYKNHQSYNSDHAECMSMTGSSLIIRCCIFQDIISSGFITDASGLPPPISNWEIYGNVFFWDSAFAALSTTFIGDGIVGFFGETFTGHFYFYNNTIVGINSPVGNVDNGGFYGIPVSGSSLQVYNNVWYNCIDIEALGSSGNDVDYNSYYVYNNGNDTSAHKVSSSSGNPFIGLSTNNFQLSADTAAGITLPAPYNNDMLGNIRGADGTWDRGAYQFYSSLASSTNPPVISGVQSTSVSESSATIVWVTDQQSTSIVQYGLSASYGNTVTNSTLTASHSITISNLSTNTTYHYLVKSANAAGYVGSSPDSTFTTLAADTNPPTVSLAAPLPNTVAAGMVPLAANATDNVAVAGVQFQVDGLPVGSAITSAPYSFSWNSASVTNGTHSIRAVATDGAGNTATSAVVNVQIQNIVTNGLVGYWNFDEGSGTLAADSSGFGDTATLSTGATWTTNAVLGASALLLNAASASSASVPDSTALEISGDLTIAMWVKQNSLPTTNSWMYYLEKGQNNQENYAFGAYSDATGTRLFFEFIDATGTTRYYTQGTGLALSAGTWTHVAVVFDHTNSQLSFFIKGKQVSSMAVAQSLTAATNPLVIGQQNITGYEFYLNGSIDDLRVYNRALAASEISALSLITSVTLPIPTGVTASP